MIFDEKRRGPERGRGFAPTALYLRRERARDFRRYSHDRSGSAYTGSGGLRAFMAYCPECLTEYAEGSPECIDCHVGLRPGAPPVPAVAARKFELPRDVKLVRVRVFSGPTAPVDAELARNWLESEGIPCVLPGENSAGLLPVLDVPLLVREEDAEEAARVLREYLDSDRSALEG